MSMLSRGNQLVDFKHFENVKSLFENVSLYIGLIAYTAAGAKVRLKFLKSHAILCLIISTHNFIPFIRLSVNNSRKKLNLNWYIMMPKY